MTPGEVWSLNYWAPGEVHSNFRLNWWDSDVPYHVFGYSVRLRGVIGLEFEHEVEGVPLALPCSCCWSTWSAWFPGTCRPSG